MFTTGGFEFPTHRSHPDDGVWATRQPRPSFSRSPCGCSNYANGGSPLRVSNLTSSPSTSGTHLGTQIGRSWYLSGQRCYHGSQDGLEADFETGSTERMESLVSGLLQDEGRENQNSFPVLASEPSRSTSNNISSSGHSPEAERGIQELHDQFESNIFVSRTRDDQGFDPDRLSGNKVSAGGRFPSTDMFPHEETPYQIFSAHESALSGSRSADNVKLSCFPRSQQSVNPTMIHEFQEQMRKISLRDIERAYAVQKKLEEMEARNREYATELQEKKTIEASRALNVYEDSTADVGQLAKSENLLNPGDLVRDLRAIANSIEQTSLVKRNSSWQTNESFVGLCKWLCQQGCPTSNTELEKAKNDIREGNRVRSHALNVDSTHSSRGVRHVRSQWTSGRDSSSPRPTIKSDNSIFPARATVCNSAAAVVRSAASGLPSPGRRQETSCVRGGFRNLGKKPDGYLRNADWPPKWKTSPCRKTWSAQTLRGADHNMKVKFTSVTGFHPRTQTSASPPIKCAQNGNSEIGSISTAKEFQPLLPKQKGSNYHAAFVGQDAGSTDGSAVRLQSIRKTKDLIAQGATSISILLKPENSARGKSSYPASSSLSDFAPVSTGSRLLSPIRRQLLNNSDDTLQLIPIERPAIELDVCNQGQFKTELCNNWQATQHCPYGDLCRFAHGVEQLRCVLRHPRYKTIACRMIMHGKACIYGHRCHFRHSLTTEELSLISVIDVHDDSVDERSLS